MVKQLSETYPFARKRYESKSQLKWDLVIVHLIVVLTIALSLLLNQPSYTLIFGGSIVFPAFLFIAYKETKRSPLWFTPLSFYFFWYSIGLGLSAIYIGFIVNDGDWLSFSVAQVSPNSLALGYVVYLCGSVSLHAGIQFFRPLFPKKRASNKPQKKIQLIWLVIMWLVGLVFIWKPELRALIGFLGGLLVRAPLAALSAFLLIPRERYSISNTRFYTFMIVGTVGLFAANLMSYSKAYIMYSFLPILWFLIITPSLRRWLPFLFIGLTIFFFTVVLPVVTLARYTPLAEGTSPAVQLIDTFETWRTGISGTLNREFYADQLDIFLVRMFDPLSVGYLVDEVKTYGLQMGSTMKYAYHAFIPRILWPDKPTITQGGWFAYYVGFAKSPEEATMSLGISATGELYLNFGLLGVLAGMLIIGCFVGKLWQMVGIDPRQEPLRMLVYVVIMFSMNNMSEAVTVLVLFSGIIMIYILTMYASRLLRAPRR